MTFKWGDQVIFQIQFSKDRNIIRIIRDYIY